MGAEGIDSFSSPAAGLDDRGVGRVSFRVRYAETDRMGVAYNAHYLTWFEMGRTEFMRGGGLPYREIEERGISLPLVDVRLKLRLPVQYDDKLVTETTITALRSRTVEFSYRILKAENVIAEGNTVHACIAADDCGVFKSAMIPAWLAENLRGLAR